MSRRLLLAVVVLAIGGPVVIPFLNAIPHADFSRAEWVRLSTLAGRTAAILGWVTLFVVPIATVLAMLLGGTNLPGRRWLCLAIVLSVAIPLPFFAVAWQGLTLANWRPFDTGIIPAATIHALAGMPWVIAILVACVSAGDTAVVENARINADARHRMVHVVVPRLRGGLILAMVWLLATVASEIVITDLMQVRTFAEEVYTQFVSPAADANTSAEIALARAITVALPGVIALWLITVFALSQTQLVPINELAECPPWFQLGRKRFLLSLLIALGVVGFLVVPLGSLIWRAGMMPTGPWSGHRFWTNLRQAVRDTGPILLGSMVWAMATAIVVTATVAIICWWARSAKSVRAIVFLFAALILVTPGPIIGLGVKATINWLMSKESQLGISVMRSWLYDGPSYLPVAWTWSIRCFPLAVAVLWPTIRDWPSDLPDATRLETGSSWAVIRHAIWPVGKRSFITATMLTALVCFGEVSASRLTATPGALTFAHDLFERMHFGLRPDLAACTLLGVMAIAVLFCGVMIVIKAARLKEPRPK